MSYPECMDDIDWEELDGPSVLAAAETDPRRGLLTTHVVPCPACERPCL